MVQSGHFSNSAHALNFWSTFSCKYICFSKDRLKKDDLYTMDEIGGFYDQCCKKF